MQLKKYSIKLNKQDFKFNCAHFICEDHERENLHGHNYQVSLEIKQYQSKLINGMMSDFREIKPIVRKICKEIDLKTIIPYNSQNLDFQELQDDHIQLKIQDSTFVLPKKDCIFLPITESTCELLANHIGNKIIETLTNLYLEQRNIYKLIIGVQESPGQKAKAVFSLN